MTKRAKRIRDFIKNRYSGYQIFDSPNIVGDKTTVVYNKDGITIEACDDEFYLDVFGLNPSEYRGLVNKDNYKLKETDDEFVDRQKSEALKRMAKLKLQKYAIREFDKEEKIYFSEWVGALYWADEKVKDILDAFLKEHPSCLPYHVIHNNTEFGELYSLLYVSGDEEEWKLDNEDLNDGYAMSYVYNCDTPEFSEFGTIAIKPSFGGLVRVG